MKGATSNTRNQKKAAETLSTAKPPKQIQDKTPVVKDSFYLGKNGTKEKWAKTKQIETIFHFL